MKLAEKAKTAVTEAVVKQGIGYLEKDPETNLPKLMDLIDKYIPKESFPTQRETIRNVINDKDSNWYQLIMRVYQLDSGVRKAFFENFILNASLTGGKRQEENMRENNCNSPWAILLDPTSACNLKCTGCWAAEYGHQLNLTLEEIDSIIRQGKEIGVYMYIYTGGEPTVRKKDIIKLCEMHPDCEFLAFTNGTLFDEEFCDELLRVKNFVPAFSLEGSEEANDGRRGKGIYAKVMHSMKLLKERGLPFGVSTCYTAANIDSVSSEEYFDKLVDCGALFAWFFHYMPVGNDASTDLLPKPEQRKKMYNSIREFRNTKPLFTLDFQNDAEYVNGCIAGGRYYLHINAKGDIEPCVFIHYSDCNIRETTLKDALKSPLFQAYHDNQPFNKNMMRPCPMLENPECLRAMVKETKAVSTDYQSPESVDDLCDKTTPYANAWKETAEELWDADPRSKNMRERKR